jgi:DNA polymerase III delta prime subunit
MSENIKKMLDEVKSEQAAEQQKMQEFIMKNIMKNGITYDNLDDNLKYLIMTKSTNTGNAPVPENPMGDNAKTDSKIVIDDVFQKVCDDLKMKNNVYLYGKAGTGKTVLAKSVANYLLGEKNAKKMTDGEDGMKAAVPPYYILNCSQWTSPMNIIGGYSIRGYTHGQMELAWKYGAVFIIDELPKLDPNTAGLLNDALSMAADKDVYLTSGRGERIPKHEDFCVIGAGNTNMKTTSMNFSGNNRQDYSLVDRFAGSFYKIGENKCLERDLTYTAVYNICVGLRAFLDLDVNSTEAITLRTMLNFNRIYQIEMLRKVRSPKAFAAVGTVMDAKKGYPKNVGKTLRDSVYSFVDDLSNDRSENCKALSKYNSLNSQNVISLEEMIYEAENADDIFKKDFRRITGKDADTGESIFTENKE